jgi:AcrR family transcriptional regulator
MCLVHRGVESVMAVRASNHAVRAPKKRAPLGRRVWLDSARQALIEEGTAGVEINKLAKRLGVSRGGFYWFYESRKHLLDELLKYWSDTSTVLFDRLLLTNGGNGKREYRALIDLWIDEEEYDPQWDAAVRDWARTSRKVLKVVQLVDKRRIAVLEQIFWDMGYKGQEAHIRARITYYHQVGYYALGVRESRKQRLKLLPFYARVLTGRDA